MMNSVKALMGPKKFKDMFHFEKHSQPFFLCVSSDEDLIFLGQAYEDIKSNL